MRMSVKIWLVMVTIVKLTQWRISECTLQNCFTYQNGMVDLTEISDRLSDEDGMKTL